jgi:hypothetical protein
MSPGTSSTGRETTRLREPSRPAAAAASERREGLLGAVLLPEREHGADHDHHDDGATELRHALVGRAPVGEKGESRGNPENEGEEVDEFPKQPNERVHAAQLFDAVRSELFEPAVSLGERQRAGYNCHPRVWLWGSRRSGTSCGSAIVVMEPPRTGIPVTRPSGSEAHELGDEATKPARPRTTSAASPTRNRSTSIMRHVVPQAASG